MRGEILLEQATVYDTHINDDAKAEAVYRRIVVLEDADVSVLAPALKALERSMLDGNNTKSWLRFSP